jgi:CheY-like chemotaxis protein
MRPSVLVVEDDIATRTLLTVLLNRAGLDVDAIGSGADAVTLLSAVSYSALLFDLQLPGASGHDILAHLEANDPETIAHAVVVSSSTPQELDRVRARYAQTPVIRKPFDLEELTAAVVRAADRDHRPRDIAAEFCRLSIVNGAKAGVVLVADDDEAQLNVVRSFGYSPDMIERFTPLTTDAPYPICAAYRSGSPVWLNSPVSTTSEYPSLQPLFQDNQSYALAAIPLTRGGKVFGAAGWTFRDARRFSERERQHFEAIATILASELH